MTKQPLVSIIMPAFNAEQFIDEAIQSVINQNYSNWELIVINDGSTDGTEQRIKTFKDSRIRCFKQKNSGVSAARNLGLKEMRGEFFCFLDADDAYTAESLNARVKYFEAHPNVHFLDGTIILKDQNLEQLIIERHMSYEGNPRKALVRLDGSCFFGPSWMVRRSAKDEYAFDESMTHAEDLLFFYTISEVGDYAAIDQPILNYRVSQHSAMSNLEGIENGYAAFYTKVKATGNHGKKQLHYLKRRIIRIMFLSYARKLQPLNAFSVLLRYGLL